MIVQSNKVEHLLKQLHGCPILVPKGFPHGFDTFNVTVEPSKAVATKVMIGLGSPPLAAYHVSAIGTNVACGCAFIELIKIVKLLDPECVIICAGLKCDVTGWETSLEKLIPCKGKIQASTAEKIKSLSNFTIGTKPWPPGKISKAKAPPKDVEVVDFPGEYDIVEGVLDKIPIAGKSKYVRSVHGAVYNFYALEEMSLNDNLPEIFVKRHKEFVASTARTMFDYLATICMSEARHAIETVWNVYGVNNEMKSRNNAWVMGREYNPRQSLKVCEYVFTHAQFPGGYGGKAWANIAKCAGRYFTLPPKSWFDHVVDLAHNGGLAFNKGVFWFNPANPGSYIKMLDRRKKGSIFDDTSNADGYGHQSFVSTHSEQKWLLYVAGITDEKGPECPPLKWGTKLVEAKMGVYNAGGDNMDDETGEDLSESKLLKTARLL